MLLLQISKNLQKRGKGESNDKKRCKWPLNVLVEKFNFPFPSQLDSPKFGSNNIFF